MCAKVEQNLDGKITRKTAHVRLAWGMAQDGDNHLAGLLQSPENCENRFGKYKHHIPSNVPDEFTVKIDHLWPRFDIIKWSLHQKPADHHLLGSHKLQQNCSSCNRIAQDAKVYLGGVNLFFSFWEWHFSDFYCWGFAIWYGNCHLPHHGQTCQKRDMLLTVICEPYVMYACHISCSEIIDCQAEKQNRGYKQSIQYSCTNPSKGCHFTSLKRKFFTLKNGK